MSDRPLHSADPKAGFLAQADEIRAAVERVLASGHYILGPEVAAFEREWADYLGGGNAIGVANGTEAPASRLSISRFSRIRYGARRAMMSRYKPRRRPVPAGSA